MEITTLISTLLSATFFSTFASAPDLCDIPQLTADGSPVSDAAGVVLAQYCEWTGPDAPLLQTNVCCDIDGGAADCALADVRGGCASGDTFYCEHGEVSADGGVLCLQPLPSMCGAGFCVQAPDVPPPGTEMVACCGPGGACQPVNAENDTFCDGVFVGCAYGVLNEDGTVECFG